MAQRTTIHIQRCVREVVFETPIVGRRTVGALITRSIDYTAAQRYCRRGCRGSGSRTGASGPITGLSGGSRTGGGGSSPGGVGIGGSSSLRMCMEYFAKLAEEYIRHLVEFPLAHPSPAYTCAKFSTVTMVTPPKMFPEVARPSHCR